MPASKGKKEAFESALKKLEKVVTSLEEGDLSLEESIKAFEQGTKLSKACEEQLNEARKKIEVLMGDKVEHFPWDKEDDDV
jgi:exodeoxyribonuclease VII small subunit